jgi:hypothetical protein
MYARISEVISSIQVLQLKLCMFLITLCVLRTCPGQYIAVDMVKIVSSNYHCFIWNLEGSFWFSSVPVCDHKENTFEEIMTVF